MRSSMSKGYTIPRVRSTFVSRGPIMLTTSGRLLRFPDVSCETMTGEILLIELEFVSPRFRDHQGQLGSVDAVLCAVRRPQDRVLYGVPVFALTVAEFSGDEFNRKTQRLAPEAEQMFRANFRFFVDDKDW